MGPSAARQPFSNRIGLFTIALGAIWLTVLAGIVDLTARSWRESANPGLVSLITGSLLLLYSVFGLFFGGSASAWSECSSCCPLAH